MFYTRPAPSDERKRLLKGFDLVSLIAGAVTMIAAGTLYSFSVYGPAFSALGASQGDVNLIAALGILGFSLIGFPMSLLHEVSGPFITCLLAAVCFTLGYLFLYLMVGQFVAYNLGGALLSYFLVGVGTRAYYVADLTSNLHNWPLEYRGRIVAIMVVFLGLSSAILTGIYVGALSRVVPSFLLLLLCVTVSLSVIGALLISEVHHLVTPSYFAYIPFLRHHHPQAELEPEKRTWLWKSLFKDAKFWLICCIHFLGTGSGFVFINVLGSWHLALGGVAGAQTTAVIVLSVFNAIGRLVIGLLSDLSLHKLKRPVWILPCLGMLALAMILAIVAPLDSTWVVGVSVLVGFGYGGNASFLATISADAFGSEFFGRNWSIIDMFNGIGYLMLGQIAGAIYGMNVPVNSVYCSGRLCYLWVWVMCLVSVTLAIVACVVLIILTPVPTCTPVTYRKKNFMTNLLGPSFFHFLGHEGLAALHRRHQRERIITEPAFEIEWDRSGVTVPHIALVN
jgi:hypothetical protein